MCCVITILLFLGPRVAAIAWWLIDSSRWNNAFGFFLWPILGIIFLPWTTLAFVLVTPNGIHFVEFIILLGAILADVLSYAGGGFGNRKRIFR